MTKGRWPDKITTSLAPGLTLVPCGEPTEVRGEMWLSYIPEEDTEDDVIVERSASGRLVRMR